MNNVMVLDRLVFHIFIDKFVTFMTQNSRADKVIRDSVVWSMGAGLIPVPLADMVAVTAVQIDMLKQIASLYQVDFAENRLKSWIAALSGSAIPKMGAGLIKIIPGLGSVVGGVSMAALSGASTYAIGQVFAQHFESGGTLLDFDVDKFKDFYQRQFEVGRAFVENLSKEKFGEFATQFGNQTWASEVKDEPNTETKTEAKTETATPNAAPSPEAIKRLKELTEFYEKGILSAEEFKMLKDKILKDGEYK
jgi:uncharacterized protein (DUF697 family)